LGGFSRFRRSPVRSRIRSRLDGFGALVITQLTPAAELHSSAMAASSEGRKRAMRARARTRKRSAARLEKTRVGTKRDSSLIGVRIQVRYTRG
jgi:hypothetical protein